MCLMCAPGGKRLQVYEGLLPGTSFKWLLFRATATTEHLQSRAAIALMLPEAPPKKVQRHLQERAVDGDPAGTTPHRGNAHPVGAGEVAGSLCKLGGRRRGLPPHTLDPQWPSAPGLSHGQWPEARGLLCFAFSSQPF